MNIEKVLFCSAFFLGALVSGVANAEIYRMPEPMNYPMEVSASVTFDPSTHLYTYSYTVTNPPSNPSGVDYLKIQMQPGVDVVTNVQSPLHWSGDFIEESSFVSWGATETESYIPSDYVDDGHSIPPYGPFVQPGASLSDFSFQSFGPPGPGYGITQTFAPIPWADDAGELEGLPFSSSLPEDNGYRFATTVPVPDTDYLGNRHPSVDGFLVFANMKNRDTFKGSALIVIRFGIGGEVVQQESFHASLNGVDVTQSFVYDARYDGYAANFLIGSSPLVIGSNVLLTSVLGTIPGVYDRPVKDTDRLAFTVKP